jgi:hypothetical protein
MSATVPTKHLTYRLSVYVTIPLTDDPEHPDFYTLERATESAFKRGLEKGIFNVLKRSEFDCDCELMDFTVEED